MANIKWSTLHSVIQLTEGKPTRIQIAKTGKFKDPRYGNFEITKKTLTDLKSNFEKKVRGIDVAFDYNHKSDEDASGWPKSLEVVDECNGVHVLLS